MRKRIAVVASLAVVCFAPAALAEEQQQTQQEQPQQQQAQQPQTQQPQQQTQHQQEQGVTSGPAAGTPVEPSGSVQKDNPKAEDVNPTGVSGPSGTSAGAPAVEGKKGTQSGKEWVPPEEIRPKKGPIS
jgi:Tfp pilus assembly protein FimV